MIEKIPRIITSMWLGGPMPTILNEYVETHSNQPGFEHRWITNETLDSQVMPANIRYVSECLKYGNYGKASDYLRMYYLEQYGGIYLDADAKILKPLDKFLEHTLFAVEERNMFIANSIFGVVPHHPLLQKYLKTVDDNFLGSGDLVFQPGMYLWTELIKYSPWSGDVKIYPAEWFLPWDHQAKVTSITENTHIMHLYLKSWM